MKKDVFISYSRQDSEKAHRLAADLGGHGISCWVDTESLKGGERWESKIKEAIEKSPFFICLLSKAVVGSASYVNSEIKHAITTAKRMSPDTVYIIPVKLENCGNPYEELRELHGLELFSNWERGISTIADNIKFYLGRKSSRNVITKAADGNDDYAAFVNSRYKAQFESVRRDASLLFVYQQAGRVYEDIHKKNCDRGISKPNNFDHTLSFYIAGWIKDNLGECQIFCV
jgi:hypothetical protein